MNKKYAYANIKIPIEIKENGKIEPLKEYTQIDFSPCHNLPNKKIDNTTILNNLNYLFTNIPSFENERIIKFKSPEPVTIPPPDKTSDQTVDQTSDQTVDQAVDQTVDQITDFTPTEVHISSIKQYKKREGASGGTVGSLEKDGVVGGNLGFPTGIHEKVAVLVLPPNHQE